jgi:DNA gyrase subunit A
VLLGKTDTVVGMVVIKREATLLVVTEKGLGKCSHIDEYRVQKRGGRGILTLNRTERTGDVVALMEVLPEDEIMLITKQGVIIRSSVAQIRVTGRNAQGVKLVQLQDSDEVTAVARVVPDDGAEGPEGEDDPDGGDTEPELLELTSEDDE